MQPQLSHSHRVFIERVLIVLAIFLRQENSPESKKVSEPNSKTGTD